MATIKDNRFDYEFEEKDGEISMTKANYEKFMKTDGGVLWALCEVGRIYETLSPEGKKLLKRCMKEHIKDL